MEQIGIYLAGAIRDNHPEDIAWREYFIGVVEDVPGVTILNPLAGKQFDDKSGLWTLHNAYPSSKCIFMHDVNCVDNARICVFNFSALAEGYPNIGTLVEFGRATKAGCLIYSIIPYDYSGHDNAKMYKLHPFLAEPSAMIFTAVCDCAQFTRQQVMVLNGRRPHYNGAF